MRYILWLFAIICQISNLICLRLIGKKKACERPWKTLIAISITLQIVAIVILIILRNCLN